MKMNKQQTAVEWLVKMLYSPVGKGFIEGRRQIPHHIIEQALAMEHEQAKRTALHFIMLGGQECGCNWNKMNFTDEFNKLINNKRSV
jgi:hypothetical protein